MELIYVYIKRFGNFISDCGMQLSNNFEVTLKNRVLTVRKKMNYLESYYGSRIKNMSVFVGKNGSGKTTILDILGMCRQDRLKNSVKGGVVHDEYLLLYYLGKDDNSQDLYGIELLGGNVLYGMFTNCDMNYNDENYDKSKASIGMVFRYENDRFISTGNHFFDYQVAGEDLNEVIRYAYINEGYRYSNRNRNYSEYYAWDGGYIAERKLVSKPSVNN